MCTHPDVMIEVARGWEAPVAEGTAVGGATAAGGRSQRLHLHYCHRMAALLLKKIKDLIIMKPCEE